MEEFERPYNPLLIEVEAVTDPTTPFALPTGTVTFLLTDVAGSTLAWQQNPTAMQTAIARHYELLDDIIGRHGGVRPVEQGEGDSVVAAFARPSDALAAALDAQRALHLEPWPDDTTLKVRMAVHTGEALQRDEGNYVGTTIIRAARIRNAGHGGQILVSEASAAVAGDQLPADSTLIDLGAHRLKDLARPERIWSLRHPDIPAVDLPLRSLDAFRHNLPSQNTPLIGRQGELRAILDELTRERIVTLSGAGGVGKSRLAAHIGAEALDRFPGGVWWVELAPLSDPGAIASAILAAMAASEDGTRPALAVASDRLASNGAALVIFDNCEHLTAAVAELTDHLRAYCSDLVIVATSREPLGVDGEIVWRVPSLSIPPTHSPTTIDALGQYDAVRLFLDRARRARPQLVLTDAQAAAVADICVRLDGIPLALELAAARCRQLPPERIAVELADRFKLLTGGARTLLPRQQTLLASVEWSHDLLSSDEQRVLRRLAVFAGHFVWDAAEAVASSPGDLDRWAVLDLLGSLVDKSLVVLDGDRYRLLETVRQFALAKARDSSELASLRDAHVNWWLEHLEAIDARQPSKESIDLCSSHLPDLRSALDWVEDDLARRYRLLALVGLNWDYGGHSDDLLAYAERWIANGPPDEEHTTAWALAFPACANAFYRGLRFDALSYGPDAVRAVHQAKDGRAALSSLFMYVPVPLAERVRFGSAAIELAKDLPRILAVHGEMFMLMMLDHNPELLPRVKTLVDSAVGHHPDPRFRWPASVNERNPAGAMCGEMATSVPPSPGDERFLVDRLLCLVYLGIRSFLTNDRERLAEATAALRRYTGVPVGRIWYSGLRALNRVADGEPLRSNDCSAVCAFTLQGSTNSRYVPARVALAAGAEDHAKALLDTFDDRPGATTVARPILDAVRALHADRISDAADAIESAAEAEALYPWDELRPDICELAAVVAHRTGDAVRAAALLAAGQRCRGESGVTYRYDDQRAWIADIMASDTVLSGDDAMALIRRGRGSRKRPTTGWDSLTPTERQVADLVAEGLTNPQVAERLIMGRETVKTHLTHVLGKLGLTNRAELAHAHAVRFHEK